MRTTVTLEPDVRKLLKDAAHRKGLPFKQVLNDAVRAGLGPAGTRAPAFKQRVFSLGRAKVDLTKAGALAADLEDAETAAKVRPSARRR
jgi:hypothetical protein